MANPTPTMSVISGISADYSWQTPNRDGTIGGVFVAADTLTATVWAGDGTTVLATPTVVWGGTQNGTTYTATTGAPLTIWTITLGPSDAAGLAPGRYRLQVFGTHSGKTGGLWDGLLTVADTAGSATQATLCTLTYAESALTSIRLTRGERDFLPYLLTVASDEIVKWCGQRDFIRQTYTEEYTVELNGFIALRQMPVNNVLRIRSYPQTILCITAASSSFQQAWVSYTTSGDWYTNSLKFTGLTLNSVGNGTSTQTALLFASYPTVAQLAAAVSAVPGWTGSTQGAFGAFPTSDLSPPGGITAQGAMDDDGAELVAYSEDLTCTRVDNAVGMLWCGRNRVASAFGGRWGPEWQILDGCDGDPIGRVQVTYDAGFSTVPSVVQHATALVAKGLIEESRRDAWLLSESVSGAGSRAYQVAESLVAALPRPVMMRLSQYRIPRAR